MTHRTERTLTTAGLARVEGEGSMYVRLGSGGVEEVRLDIYEPPRFFEAFLRGRAAAELPDIVARICGICPVAYQTSACQAIEALCGIKVTGALADLRRLLYCGEWISSHALHIYMLHAPDFLGYPGAVEMAADHRALVERGLALRKAGTSLMEMLGGRSVHPVNVRIGGFYRAPARADLEPLAGQLRRALDDALATVRWVAGFDFPDMRCEHEMLALTLPGTYPIEAGTLATTGGLAFPAADFEQYVIEEQVPHSTALHARLAGRPGSYLTGPLARYALNSAWLPPAAAQAAAEAGLGPKCRNPFQSIVVRAVETVCAIEEAIAIIDRYEPPARPHELFTPVAGTGHGVSEAPRGTLYTRFELAADGTVRSARIIPPTAQNQAAIQADLREFVQDRLDLDDARLTHDCEQAIRNYDPCISCAAHFLRLQVDRGAPGPAGAAAPR
ncbi:MAG: Ni/Fe hydrogenase subunit alpha [Streptosporangiaceae bacterium]